MSALDPEKLFPDASAEFQRFFESIGYTVSCEGRTETGERWYEIRDDEGLAFQISMPPPPIEELVTDLPHLIRGKIDGAPAAGVGPTDYWFACEDDGKLRELLRRATAARHEEPLPSLTDHPDGPFVVLPPDRESGRDPDRECVRCKGRRFQIIPGKPYQAYLRCMECGKRQP